MPRAWVKLIFRSQIYLDMETLIDNCGHFTIWLDEGPVLLGESGIVVSFSRTAYTKLKKRPITGHLTIRFEDKNGASVDFHTWCACRPLWPLEYGLNNAKVWLFVSRADEFRSPWDPSSPSPMSSCGRFSASGTFWKEIMARCQKLLNTQDNHTIK